ncbi:MAG TPA: RDD family protein [Acidimicrobiia bacterium]|jgi:uncharacterized RDD family membrane protein YckC|nr:RDD family protein [Acidimicrobiia bacterium]
MFAQLQVTTPEGVTFKYDLAGAGSRSMATAIDACIYVGVLMVLNTVLGIVAIGLAAGGIGPGFIQSLFLLINFIFLWGYRIVMETYKSGSVGYKVMGLTVVTHRGSKPLFWQCAVRGLLWPVEALFFSIIGFVSIVTTKHSQRLADLITGTMVVHRNRDARLGTLQVQDAALAPDAAFRTWELSQVSDDEIFLIRRFLDRRVTLPSHIRLDLANRLYKLVWPKVSGVPTTWYAEAVLEGIAASRAVANER